MKFLTIVFMTVMTLNAGIFGTTNGDASRESRLQQKEMQELFRKSVSDANGVIKRGEYAKAEEYRSGMKLALQRLETLSLPAEEKRLLVANLQNHTKLVEEITANLQKEAPDLNTAYRGVIGGLDNFNKKLSGIGLSELLQEWRALSRIKNRFVKKPSPELERAFEETWTSVVVTITELYLDDEMEEPLFAYLDHYKAYFEQLSRAYKQAGYDNVIKVKPLGYQIKLQLELLVPRAS